MSEPPTEPLLTVADLRAWTQEVIDDEDPFALNILWGVSIKLWQYGDKFWTRANLPAGAKLIGDLKAKNFWQHPTGASREQVDVLSETFVNDVLQHLTFTETEIAELRDLAGPPTDGTLDLGVWALTTTRGPLETHAGAPDLTAFYRDAWGSDFPLLPKGFLGWP